MKRRMNGGQALVRSLAAQGVAVTFGVPGAGQYEAVDAYFDTDGIRYVSCRNEQPTTHMADGYARTSNRPASALVVPGPGLFNASGGVSTALRSSSPIIVISGSPEDRLKGASSSHWLEPITKWSAQATSPGDVAAKVPEAVRAACSGRPRPVYLEVSATVLAQEEEVEIAPPAAIEPPAGDGAALERAAALLSDAERPLILAGTGVHRSGAAAALAELAERLPAPVATTTAGKGAISDRSPLALGHSLRAYAPLVEFAQSRDVVLAVGTQYGPAGLLGVDPERVIRVDLDADALAADQALAIEADARGALETLTGLVTPGRAEDPTAAIAALNGVRFGAGEQLEPQRSYIEALRAATPDDGVFAYGMNQMGYYSRNYYRVYAPDTYFDPRGNLGAALPIAMGAKVARPDAPVVACCGDGGVMYHIQELATAVLHDIAVTVVVFNDNAYGNVKRSQQEDFGGRLVGVDLRNPDFVRLSESFGVRGARVQDPAALRQELERAFAGDEPVLIEVPVGELERVY
ncbi:MAG: thiamine pyrophosphate-binding protein [Spirochaetaceae bacterium]|nr:thiamine pyrophosphate-binding protein [Spirochaetaceae bacterium]